jgi:hypothetical protein
MQSNDHLQPFRESEPVFTRRRALGLFALSGLGLLTTSSNGSAFWDFFDALANSGGPAKPVNVPASLIRDLGPHTRSYATYLARLSLRHVDVVEVLEAHAKTRGGVKNTLPPRSLWGNIRNTIRVVDKLVDRLDAPITTIVSVYRSPAYNRRCAGAKSNSYHLRNNAIDIKLACPPGKVASMARAMRGAGLFRGGVGRYGSFTHIDTRGSNSDW